MILRCEICGRDVEIYAHNGIQMVVHAADCPTPRVTLMTTTRKRLGTVTALDVHAGEN